MSICSGNSIILKKLCIYLAYILSCLFAFLQCFAYKSILETLYLHYFITILVFLSFDYLKFDGFKCTLFAIFPLTLVMRNWLMIWVLFAFAYQINSLNIKIANIAKLGFLFILVELLIQIGGNILGVFDANAVYVEKTKKLAFDLGLGNPNHVGTITFFFISLLYLLIGKKHLWFFIVFSIITNMLMFDYCSSRTCFYGNYILIIGCLAYHLNLFNKWTKTFVALIPIMIISGLVYLVIFFKALGLDYLNDLTSGRLNLFFYFFVDFSLKDLLIGKPLDYETPLDNSYLFILHQNGIITILLFCYAYIRTIWKCFNSIKVYIPFIGAILLVSLTESILSSPSPVSIIFWAIIIKSLIPSNISLAPKSSKNINVPLAISNTLP